MEVHRNAAARGGQKRVGIGQVGTRALRARRLVPIGKLEGVVGVVRLDDRRPHLLLHGRGVEARNHLLVGQRLDALASPQRARLVAPVRAPIVRVKLLAIPPAVLLELLLVLVPGLPDKRAAQIVLAVAIGPRVLRVGAPRLPARLVEPDGDIDVELRLAGRIDHLARRPHGAMRPLGACARSRSRANGCTAGGYRRGRPWGRSTDRPGRRSPDA